MNLLQFSLNKFKNKAILEHVFECCAYLTKNEKEKRQTLQIAHFDLKNPVIFTYFFARLIIMLQFRDCFFEKAMLQ
jgi:hypothetical protein